MPTIKTILILISMLMALGAGAEKVKSFSKQMNEIKRSGDYVYAESSASSEEGAKSACDELLKIEITKYMSSSEGGNNKIIRNISEYDRKYLVQPRGDMVRVFGYVAKNEVKSSKKTDKKSKNEETVTAKPEQTPPVLPQPEPEPGHSAASESQPTSTSAPTPATGSLNTTGLHLAKWQLSMLESLRAEPDRSEAKKTLNRYKTQNRVKRLGDASTHNPRPSDTYYLVYNSQGMLSAFLAPSATGVNLDMLSGTDVDISSLRGKDYLWFQISK